MRAASARTRATVRHRPTTARIVDPRRRLDLHPLPARHTIAAPGARAAAGTPRLGLAVRWWLALGMVAGSVLVVLGLRLHVDELGYEIARLRVETQALEHEQDALRLQLSALTEPGRIAERASRELGMHLPKPDQLRTYE